MDFLMTSGAGVFDTAARPWWLSDDAESSGAAAAAAGKAPALPAWGAPGAVMAEFCSGTDDLFVPELGWLDSVEAGNAGAADPPCWSRGGAGSSAVDPMVGSYPWFLEVGVPDQHQHQHQQPQPKPKPQQAKRATAKRSRLETVSTNSLSAAAPPAVSSVPSVAASRRKRQRRSPSPLEEYETIALASTAPSSPNHASATVSYESEDDVGATTTAGDKDKSGGSAGGGAQTANKDKEWAALTTWLRMNLHHPRTAKRKVLFVGHQNAETSRWVFELNESLTWDDVSDETKQRLGTIEEEARMAFARKYPNRDVEEWERKAQKYRPQPGSSARGTFRNQQLVPLGDIVKSLFSIWKAHEEGVTDHKQQHPQPAAQPPLEAPQAVQEAQEAPTAPPSPHDDDDA